MDINEHIEQIIRTLNNSGYSIKDSIIICEKTIDSLKSKLIEVNRNKTLNGYKIVRFKKPLPPIEERKVYKRVCRRCDVIYPTLHKFSWFCDKCKLKGVIQK